MPPAPSPLRIGRRGPLRGRVRAPGDKSISHRAVILGGLAVGESRLSGLLESADVTATIAAMRALGSDIARAADGDWYCWGVGVGGLLQPAAPLDMGNSGTSTRLLMGLTASHPLSVEFRGDASLSRRPMARVAEPLAVMGADVALGPGGTLPATVRGLLPAIPITYRMPVASAQVKSAVLLAGLNTAGITRIVEPTPTRDHTERLLRAFGAELTVEGDTIALTGEAELRPQSLTIPGDPSAAAFWLVAATIVPGSEVVIENVMLNPGRDGLITALLMMGADIVAEPRAEAAGERVADLRVRNATLSGAEIPPELAPSMIDEFPALFVAAAFAQGITKIRGAGELRVKESDRLAVMAAALQANGAAVSESADGLTITGSGGEAIVGGGRVATTLDHRVAMSMAVAGLHVRRPLILDNVAPVATSYPDFFAHLDQLTGTSA